MLIDTHCHIHESIFEGDADEALARARDAGVEKVICVGTNEESSRLSLEFSSSREGVYSSIGVHPHDTKDGWDKISELVQGGGQKLIAIGEIGLDYFYTHSPKEVQIKALEQQLQLAIDYNLPVIFHVREAFSDFWPIIDNFSGVRGELHSFTDTKENMEKGLKRGFYIGVNGISTFTKDETQKEMFAGIPLQKMLLETDAPFLTPAPFRGKVNEPAFVREVARFNADARGVLFDEITSVTTANATALFNL
jgi:TatD DNase family protein